MRKIIGSLFVTSLLMYACSDAVKNPVVKSSDPTEPEAKVYLTVSIGKQLWMAENLDESTFRNGDTIHNAQTYEEWVKAGLEGTPAWCYYENDTENGKKYGKLYNWYAVNDPRGLAPAGWHIPSDEEWTQLSEFLGGKEAALPKLKSTTEWIEETNGTNQSGFNGFPCGFRKVAGPFIRMGSNATWWSSTERDERDVWYRGMYYASSSFDRYPLGKRNGCSVRCVKDQSK